MRLPWKASVDAQCSTLWGFLGGVPLSGTCPFWTHKSLCFEPYPAAKIDLYPLQGHHLEGYISGLSPQKRRTQRFGNTL